MNRALARGLLLALAAARACKEQSPPPDPRIEALGRCASFDPERRPHFGDTHVHTALSLDANL